MTNKIFEGGAMPGVGPIHISEIEPTLKALEKTLGIDLLNNTLGSVGKKQFSGDIDVALQIEPDAIPEFMDKLKNVPEIIDMAKSSVIMTKVKIVGYDANKESPDPNKPRTGFVQVDFMPGDPGFMKVFYHAPSETESKYKGVFRNIMLSAIAAYYQRQDSEEKTDDGRPMRSERYIWSPTNGLVRIVRTPVPKKTGDGFTKKNNDEIISDPIKTAPEIARELGLDGPEDLNSYESLKASIEKNYKPELVQKILTSFADNGVVKDIGVPDDLKTESLADKHLNRIKTLIHRI